MRIELLLSTFLLAGLTACATSTPEPADTAPAMEPAEAAEVIPAPAPSLADELPADTLIYVEVPDVQDMRARMPESALGRIYHDSEMQEFIGPLIGVIEGGWDTVRGMASSQGIPAEAVSWSTLQSVEAGLAIRAAAGLENPFDEEPEIFVLARIGVSEGMAVPLFNVCVEMLGEQLEMERVMTDTGEIATALEDDFAMELRVDSGTDQIELEFVLGNRGEGTLSESGEFRLAHHRLDQEGAVVFGYLDFTVALETLIEGLSHEAPQFAAPLARLYDRALAPIRAMSFTSGWSDAGAFTAGLIDLDAAPEDELWHTAPADRALLEYVPADATLFRVADASAAGAWLDLLLGTFDEFSEVPIEEEQSLRDMVQAEGGDMYTWLWGEKRAELDAALDSLGSRAFGWGRTEGFQQSGADYLELRDGQVLNDVLEEVMPRLREAVAMADAPFSLQAKRLARRVEGETVAGPAYYYLDMGDAFPQELAMVAGAFEPTFGVTEDGWLVTSTSKQPVREALRDGVKKPEENILGNEEVQAFLARADENAYGLSWTDPRPAMRAAAGMLLGMAPMMASNIEQSGLPIDMAKLPSADLFVRHLQPTETVATRHGDDVYVESVGSFGVADLFTVGGAAVAVAPMFLMAEGGEMGGGQEPGPEPEEF